MRLWGFDAVASLRPAPSQPPAVVVVDIDEESLATLGQWPWPRDVLGRVVDRLVAAEASIIVLDMLLAEADRMSTARLSGAVSESDPLKRVAADRTEDNDAILAAAMGRGRVVSAAAAMATGTVADDRTPIVGRMAVRGAPGYANLPASTGLIRPLPVIEQASPGIGIINLYPDLDGVMRTVPGALVVDQTLLPGLAIEAARAADGANNLILLASSMSGPDGILVGNRFVPTDKRGRLWIDTRHSQRIPVIAAHRLLGGDVANTELQGRIAVVGVSAAGIGLSVKTASGAGVASAVFQALAIDSILDHRVMARPAFLMVLELAAAVVIGLTLILGAPWFGLTSLGMVAAGLGVTMPSAAGLVAFGAITLVDFSFPLLVGLVLAGHLAVVRVHEQSVLRRRQSALLAQQDAYMRQVVDASFDAIITVDREARILTANAGAERLFKVPAEQLRDSRVEEWLIGFWARAVREEPERALRDSVRGHQIIAAATDRGSGVQVPIELTVAETAASGLTFVIVLRDISARIGAEAAARQAVERLRDAVERITDGFALFGPDRRLVICNARFVDMLGEAGSTARPGGRYDVIMECYAETSRAPVSAVGRGRDWVAERTAALAETSEPAVRECLDGRWFRIDERSTAEGGLVCVYTDITELKHREMEITQAMISAESASSAKSEFLANMSHELRTPLNAVIGFADLMKQELFGPLGHDHYREYVEDIIGSGSKLLSMIEVILDFSRSEQVGQSDSDARCALNDVVGAVVRDLSPIALQKNIDVSVDRDETLPPLNVDGAILYQILQNLLSNAIKFSNPGAPIGLRTFRAADGSAGMSVTDHGVGIPDELIDKVTQPFWQRQGPLVRDHDGVGLGLAIVKSHTDALGGELKFDSQVGRGTTVTILLPASRTIRPS
jgi:PAS domain S-box-containing protein